MLVIHNWKECRKYMPRNGESYRIGPAIQTAIFHIGTFIVARVDREDIPGYKRIFGNSFYAVV